MSSHGKYDNAANAPYWAVNSTIVNATNVKANYSAPTADNVALLYANTTADVYTVGETIGLFGVDANEINVDGKVAHQGWVLRTTGSGGRAGRVQQEVLVAMSSFDTDGEDTVYQDAVVSITSQPSTLQGPVSAASANTVSFSVVAAITAGNSSAPLTYQWQVNNNSGGTWVGIDPGTGVTSGQPPNMTKTGANTATLVLDPTGTAANNFVFRCVVTATGTGASATSANGRILITT
jgi:hypothetical protein